jgi:glycine oxidase
VAVEWLEGDEVRRREPVLHASVRGALWFSAVGSLRGHRLTTALARAAQLGGATILEGTPVLGLVTAGGRVTGARIAGDELRAGQTVLAAGAWTAGIASDLGLPLPTRPVRGQMLALTGAEPSPRHILDGAGGYLIPRADGAVAAGATVDEGAGFDARVTPDGLTWLAGLVRALAPALTGARVTEVWAGLRPGSADGAPLLGRVPGYDGLWVAAGHGRNGILWAPVTADILATSILAGHPDPALTPYDPARFTRAPVPA